MRAVCVGLSVRWWCWAAYCTEFGRNSTTSCVLCGIESRACVRGCVGGGGFVAGLVGFVSAGDSIGQVACCFGKWAAIRVENENWDELFFFLFIISVCSRLSTLLVFNRLLFV